MLLTFELLGCGWVVFVLVRVVLQSGLAVCFLDFILTRRGTYTCICVHMSALNAPNGQTRAGVGEKRRRWWRWEGSLTQRIVELGLFDHGVVWRIPMAVCGSRVGQKEVDRGESVYVAA